MSKKRNKELRQIQACEWLQDNYLQFDHIRHDIVTDRLQIKNLDSLESCRMVQNSVELSSAEKTILHNPTPPLHNPTPDCWRNMTDKDINTMVCQCVQETGCCVGVSEIITALRSDLVPDIHPPRAYLQSLPTTSNDIDWIDLIAKQVSVIGGEEANHYWRQCFKKWFVAMVASWMKDEVVNHTVLVLVGRQGIYKTTWLDHLIPPELRDYSSKLPLSGQISKDDRLRLCENVMLNIDELDAICGREMNIVKSLLTSTDVNERAAYGRLKERRVRLASFCASTNNREFLTDITGNRRWLPFEVESIQNPFYTTLPYQLLYAQAKQLVENGYFIYWFEPDEIEVLEQHNEEFRVQEGEEQLLTLLFDIPAIGKGKFMTTAEISEKLVTYGNIKKPMGLRQLGNILSNKGYTSHRATVDGIRQRGWVVYERTVDELQSLKNRLKE